MSPEREEAIRLRQINQRLSNRQYAAECEDRGLSHRFFKLSLRYSNNARREELREERRINREYPSESLSPHA